MIVFVAPDKKVKPGSVSGGALTALGFQDVFLVDGRPAYPYRGTWPATVTPDVTRSANVYAITRHLIPAAATVTINGVVLTVPTWGRDGIPLNVASVLTTPVSTGGSFTVTASAGELIGDVWVGEGETVSTMLHGRNLSFGELQRWEAALGPYWDGYSQVRIYEGQVVYGNSDYAKLEGWYASTKKGTEPSLVILDGEVLLCILNFTEVHNERWHFAQISLVSIPNGTW